MANAKLIAPPESNKITGTVVLEMTPEEAHAIYLLTREVGGNASITIRKYTASVQDALRSLQFADIDTAFDGSVHANNPTLGHRRKSSW